MCLAWSWIWFQCMSVQCLWHGPGCGSNACQCSVFDIVLDVGPMHASGCDCRSSALCCCQSFLADHALKVARNEVENASFAQRSAHCDSRIWRPELIEPAVERKRRARGRRPTFKSAYPDPQILPQCNISSNYPYNVWFF